jgi:MFS transporter, putative metabolite:H+ symporter
MKSVSIGTAAQRPATQRQLLVSAGVGWLFDAMDVGLMSFVIAALTKAWHLTPGQAGWLGSINSIGMAVGAAFAGFLADRYGRRPIFMVTLLMFSIATGLSAFATGFAILAVLRFIIGLGLGGELPVASTLVSESVPVEKRGRVVVLLESFWAGGWLIAALIAYFIIPKYGWQMAFIIGALPAIYAVYLRRNIPDSPRYLNLKKKQASFTENLASIWASDHRKSTLMLWTLWFTVVFSYYGIFLWLPTVMVMKGFTLIKSFEYVLIMTLAQLPGYFSAAYLIERVGRKFVLTLYLVMTAICSIWFGNAHTITSLVIAGALLSFFNLGAWGGLYAYSPEQYPTRIRSTGVGMAASFGRIGGIIAPLLVGILVEGHVSLSTIFTLFFIVTLIGAFAVAFFGKETRNKELAD